MAWYEETGPDACHVRDVIFKEMEALYPTLSPNYIKNSLQNHILDSKKDFGSWRGWATFGLAEDIQSSIQLDMNQGVEAMKRIRHYLQPFIFHYLYKPGGIRMSKIGEETLVGKPVRN